MSTTTPHPAAGEHSSSACRQSRHTRVQHLVTADENSLAELELLLTTLPLCSTGRVFVEVPDATHIVSLSVPARMVLTWLDRSRRTGAPGTGQTCAPGSALSRAVTAWSDEMLCGDHDGTRIHLLGGYLGTADIVDHLIERHGVAPADIHAPERFGLLSSR
jgi:hypothetical protein